VKDIKGKHAEFHYAMFLMAICQIWRLETAPNRKAQLTEKELARNIRLSMVNKGKSKNSSKKRQKLLRIIWE
jgi:hypothetical protein